jgi:small subunit ribosomal protein S2
VPCIAIVDTNCDPTVVDYPIPGNDDAIKSISLIISTLADAVLLGREGVDDQSEEPKPEAAASGTSAPPEEKAQDADAGSPAEGDPAEEPDKKEEPEPEAPDEAVEAEAGGQEDGETQADDSEEKKEEGEDS